MSDNNSNKTDKREVHKAIINFLKRRKLSKLDKRLVNVIVLRQVGEV